MLPSFSAAVAAGRDRPFGSNCMLFCVSIRITHFWLVEAMGCLIKALPQKKNRLITGEIIKGSEWLCCVTLKMEEENKSQKRKEGCSQHIVRRSANIQAGQWTLNGSFVCN